MDEVDLAAAEVETFRAAALMTHLRERRCGGISADISRGARLCLDCGEQIDRARLRAVPGAVRCVECQSQWERRNG